MSQNPSPTAEETQAALGAARAAYAAATTLHAALVADPKSSGAEIAASGGEVLQAEAQLAPAEAAHAAAVEAAQASQRDAFAASLADAMKGHDTSVLQAVEDVERCIGNLVAANGAREAARKQLAHNAGALGVPGDSRAETFAGVNLTSTKRAVAARVARSLAPVFRVPGVPASGLDAIARTPSYLPDPTK